MPSFAQYDAKFGNQEQASDGPPPAPLGHIKYEIVDEGAITILSVEF
jgi:hypothetical protein